MGKKRMKEEYILGFVKVMLEALAFV